MFFDEEMLLDLRLNIMDRYVDKFVITESSYMHSGKKKELIFDINKYSKFKDKIIYIPIKEQPRDLIEVNSNDSLHLKQSKMIRNAKIREMYQINRTQDEINKADSNDIIIISDLDEIPNLEKINFNDINNKLIFFIQKMFYYKFNLFHKSLPWFGSKACKKKYFKSPEWLRSIKNKKYPKWRFDTLLSDSKYSDICFVYEGGWHFTNMRKPKDLEEKLSNFLHHVDYQESGLQLKDLERLIKEKKIMYNHAIDQKGNKWGDGEKLEIINIDKLPSYIKENQKKFINWLEL